MNSYTVWDYSKGHKSYYKSMKFDLSQPPDKVNEQNGAMLHERRAVSLRYSTASDYYL